MASTVRVSYWDRHITKWAESCYNPSRTGLLDRLRTSVNARMEVALQLMARHLRPGGYLVDLGCGTGHFAIEAVRRGLVSRALGVDFSASGVRFANHLAGQHDYDRNRCHFEVGDATTFEIPADATLVTGLGLLDWLEEDQIVPLLCSFGRRRIIVSYSEQDGTFAEIVHRYWLCERLRWFGNGVRAYHHSRPFIRRCLREAGAPGHFQFVKTPATRFGTLAHNLARREGR